MKKNVLLVRMGEIFLKGDNRNFFIKALVRNLRKSLEGTPCTLELTQGRIFLRDIEDMDEVVRRVTRVFGVHSVSPVVECDKDMELPIIEEYKKILAEAEGKEVI